MGRNFLSFVCLLFLVKAYGSRIPCAHVLQVTENAGKLNNAELLMNLSGELQESLRGRRVCSSLLRLPQMQYPPLC